MRIRFALTTLAGLALAASLSAKGVTTRITIQEAARGTIAELTDPKVLAAFNVWSGPGTFGNGVEGTEGFIIDWAAGNINLRPTGLARHQVMFYVRHPRSTSEQLAYVVQYENDPATGQGFVYLPGRSDEFANLNGGSIHRGRGFEGNWFRASSAWQQAVAPLLKGR